VILYANKITKNSLTELFKANYEKRSFNKISIFTFRISCNVWRICVIKFLTFDTLVSF